MIRKVTIVRYTGSMSGRSSGHDGEYPTLFRDSATGRSGARAMTGLGSPGIGKPTLPENPGVLGKASEGGLGIEVSQGGTRGRASTAETAGGGSGSLAGIP